MCELQEGVLKCTTIEKYFIDKILKYLCVYSMCESKKKKKLGGKVKGLSMP